MLECVMVRVQHNFQLQNATRNYEELEEIRKNPKVQNTKHQSVCPVQQEHHSRLPSVQYPEHRTGLHRQKQQGYAEASSASHASTDLT
jgi:hypothetical protein